MYKASKIILALFLFSVFNLTLLQGQELEEPCAKNEVKVKLTDVDKVLCVDEDTAESWIESKFAVAFDEEAEQDNRKVEKESGNREPLLVPRPLRTARTYF